MGIIQSFATIAFLLALTAMVGNYFDDTTIASIMFLCAIALMIMSLSTFARKIQIANTALDVHLSDFEKYQEWQQYLKPKRKRCARSKKLVNGTVKPEHIKKNSSGNEGVHV